MQAELRVIGSAGDVALRIENRVGEPMANPYLYIAAQTHSGRDGIAKSMTAPLATNAPYAGQAPMLPTSLGDALHALESDRALEAAFGAAWVDRFAGIKRSELARHDAAEDQAA